MLYYNLAALACAALFGWLGYRVSKGRKTVALLGVLFGFGFAMFSPLRELNQTQPYAGPLVHIQVPEDFKYHTVIFIDDPSAHAEIAWSKDNVGKIVSPKSGVVRVKSLGPLDNQESHALLSDGRQDWGLLNSNIGAARIVVYDFNQGPATDPELSEMSESEAARYVRQREAQ